MAEVSDKIPSLTEIWTVAGIAAVVMLLASRFRPWLLLLAAPLPALWFISLLMEIHSPDVGPAILQEQGTQFVVQSYLAGLVAAAAAGLGWWWRRGALHRRPA